MRPSTLALLGTALLAMPAAAPGAARLRAVAVPPGGPAPPRWGADVAGALPALRAYVATVATRRRSGPIAAAVTALVISLATAPAAGVAAGVLVAVAAWLARRAGAARYVNREVDALLEALSALTGELRSGRPPGRALRAAGEALSAVPARASSVAGGGRDGGATVAAASPVTAGALLMAAATASLGGDVPGALRAAASGQPARIATVLHRIAAGWQVSERSGASLAGVLERVEHDLRARRRHARQVAAQLAGPRATGLLLASLPLFGTALGAAMGAHPVAVLLDTGAGQVALLVGVLLEAAGALWIARLLHGGAEP